MGSIGFIIQLECEIKITRNKKEVTTDFELAARARRFQADKATTIIPNQPESSFDPSGDLIELKKPEHVRWI
jgi:hypothetical protein